MTLAVRWFAVLACALLLIGDAPAQRRGGGRSNPRPAGRSTPTNRPPREAGEEGEAEEAPRAPRSTQRLEIRWLDGAAPDGVQVETEGTLIDEALKGRARAGIPTLLWIHNPSDLADTLQRRIFRNDDVRLASSFATFIRVSVPASAAGGLAKAVLGNQPAALLVFDGDQREVKRLKAGALTATSVINALKGPVKLAFKTDLVAWLRTEREILDQLDDLSAQHAGLVAAMEELVPSADSGSKSAARKLDEMKAELERLTLQSATLEEREKRHLETALSKGPEPKKA